MNASFAIALWGAFDTRTAVIDFLATQFILLTLSERTLLEIRIEGGWLYAGKAKIELKYISSITVLNRAEMAALRTRDANADAYLDLRFWVNQGIKIELNDERDYTPYWLISTRAGATIKAAAGK